MVEEGLGYAICFDHLINTLGESLLCLNHSVLIKSKLITLFGKSMRGIN